MGLTIADIAQLYRFKGSRQYSGEVISQLDHALQCAALAKAAQESQAMVVACFLHDLGHLLDDLGYNLEPNTVIQGRGDRHEERAIPALQSLYHAAVTEPIRLHVQAKRYLCQVDATYWAQLSDASKCSLELQGGAFSRVEADAFITQPYALNAVKLRRWDDQAKVVDLPTPEFEHFVSLMNVVAIKP
jgi:phosphonate degradation associated HDIG domain protein